MKCSKNEIQMILNLLTSIVLWNLGECWSGENSKINIEKDGTSEKCIAEKFEPCSYNSYHCVGQDHTNRVYRLIEGIMIMQK